VIIAARYPIRTDPNTRICGVVKSQVKLILSTKIQNSPPLVPGTGSSRRAGKIEPPCCIAANG